MKLHLIVSMILFSMASHSSCNLFGYGLDDVVSSEKEVGQIEIKSEEKFNEIIDNVSSLYKDQIARMGKTFNVKKYWNENHVNAYANKSETSWTIFLYGGVFKAKQATEDSLALVVCHEIGHLLGGAPFYSGTAASAEGQADFWATSICFKKYTEVFKKNTDSADLTINSLCSDSPDTNNCHRNLQASLDLAKVLARDSNKEPSYSINLAKVLKATKEDHPDPQCRLETYKRGYFCDLPFDDEEFISKSNTDKLTTDFKCPTQIDGTTVYLEQRPTCWFNQYVNTMYADWKKLVKSKTLLGLKKSSIEIKFANHLKGDYTIILEPDQNSDTNQYISIPNNRISVSLGNNETLKTFKFDFQFIKKANKKLSLNLVILKEDAQIGSLPIEFEAYSSAL